MTSGAEMTESVRALILAFSFALASVFIVLGVLVDRYKRYGLIAGYNRAPEEVRKQYDIEGLASHLGNGLITLGVLLIMSSILFWFGLVGWSTGFIGLFVFVAFIIVIGGQKFLPKRRNLAAHSPGDAAHPFLRWVLPDRIFRAIERGTREWLIECGSCGHRRDFWEAGGVRGKGVGEPRSWNYCPQCGKWSWNRIRKKSAEEKLELC